jgi:hypothetical protein
VSVLVITRVPGDTQQFRNFMASGAQGAPEFTFLDAIETAF